jgi:hypothetical protein
LPDCAQLEPGDDKWEELPCEYHELDGNSAGSLWF